MRALLWPLGLAFYLASLLQTHTAAAADSSALDRPELKSLQDALRKTQRLSARFKQSRHWAALQDTLVTEGSIRYQKGGAMVWHTDPPAESTLTLEGRTATLSTPGVGGQETVDLRGDPAMARVFDSIAAVLQADLETLRPLFGITLVKVKGPLELELRPRSAELAKTVERIRLSFETDKLTRVVLDEGSGDRTEISFFKHQIETAPR